MWWHMSSKVWGYVRVSQVSQVTDRQVDLLMREYEIPEDDIFVDKISGTKFERPSLTALQKVLREKDTVVVESLSRLSRRSADLLTLLNYWQERGITLISHKESLDFSSVTGKFMLTMLAALSQFERDNLAERVKEGLAAARVRGRVGGRPRTDKKAIEKALKLYDAKTHSIREICQITNTSKSVLYRELKLRSELAQTNSGPGAVSEE